MLGRACLGGRDWPLTVAEGTQVKRASGSAWAVSCPQDRQCAGLCPVQDRWKTAPPPSRCLWDTVDGWRGGLLAPGGRGGRGGRGGQCSCCVVAGLDVQ